MGRYIGIEIGGTKLQLVTGDGAGRILQRRKLTVEAAKGAEGIRAQIEEALPELLSEGRPEAIGVGFGGPVDWQHGKICRSHQIEGWSEFDLSGWLGRLSGRRVYVENDANVAALGEAMHGAGVGFNPVFYVTLGSGVGGGLVVEGRIYHGAAPGEAEIGHVRLDREGTILESRCSGWAVDAKIRAAIRKEPDGYLAQMMGGKVGGEAKQLAHALGENDLVSEQILEEMAGDLAFGLSHVTHLFHPQVIIIGGGLSGIGEPLRVTVESALRPHLMEAFVPGPRIVLATLGEDAVPVGAIALAVQRMAVEGR